MIPALAGDCRDEMSPGFIDRIRGIYEEQETLLIKDDVRARVGALHLDHLAGMLESPANAPTLDLGAYQLSTSLGLAEDETQKN